MLALIPFRTNNIVRQLMIALAVVGDRWKKKGFLEK